jgi:hypothetical protein
MMESCHIILTFFNDGRNGKHLMAKRFEPVSDVPAND